MSDAIRLPARPHLDQYRKIARDFQRACREGTPEAIRAWAAAWMDRLEGSLPGDVERIERNWNRLVAERGTRAECTLSNAQFFIARVHEFPSWPAFAAHVDALARDSSGTARFESAVDAIVSGDEAALRRLLDEDPDLVHARSTREHRATLLHYVSANGVEDFRQKTPPNIVEIARLLLDAGADVNSESNSYGAHDTTLLLAATSVHPEIAGVQVPLLELLLERGAAIDWPPGSSTVNACLHNGRGPAADLCAARGARLDLEGAAGVGNLDVMRSFVDDAGTLKAGATATQLLDGLAWAAQFGKTDAVEFLLARGVDVAAMLRHHGNTALHWAAYGGHPDTVALLLVHGAPVNEKDRTYDGTPLDWAIHAWGNRDLTEAQRAQFYDVVRMLVAAGGAIDGEWIEKADDDSGGPAWRKLHSDERMLQALGYSGPRRTTG